MELSKEKYFDASFLIRLTQDMLKAIREKAEDRGVSGVVRELLQMWLNGEIVLREKGNEK